MKSNLRYDRASVKATFDEFGFMVDTPAVARIGVQEYRQPDGSVVREFRPAAEVFHHDSLESYRGKPITVGHVVVNSKNAKGVMVGSCCGVGFRNDISVNVPITVHADEAITKAKNKEAAEISVGYDALMVNEPGWGSETTGEYILDKDKKDGDTDHIPSDWVRFDAVQTRIRVNHVALVFRGRAGIAKLNLDSDQDFPYDDIELKKTGGIEMAKIKLDSVEYEVAPQVQVYIDKLSARADTAESTLTTITVERDTLKQDAATFPDKLKEAREDAAKAVKARSALEAVLTAHGVEFKADQSDKDLKVALVGATTKLDLTGKSDGYIDVAFDMAIAEDGTAIQRQELHGDSIQDKKGKREDALEIPDPMRQLDKLR